MTDMFATNQFSKITLGAVFAACLLGLGQAQEAAKVDLKFEELKAKLSMDPSPIKPLGPQASYADMLDTVTPAVVTIFSKREPDPRTSEMMDDPLFRRLFPDHTPDTPVTGAGVLVTPDGYILTNNHVVEKSQELRVRLDALNRDYDAKFIVADPKTDVALIKISANNLPVAAIGDSQKLRVGDVTFAIGNPFGLSQTVTMGIVSALGRSSSDVSILQYADLIQTDAAINRGNSGGALIDVHGRLVGINTAIQGGMTGGNLGIGFAIPSNMALDIVNRLLQGGGKVRRGFLGVSLQPLDHERAQELNWKENYGVIISQVGNETPAKKAGLEPKDIITSFQGQQARNLDSLRLRISNTPPDKEVTFGIVRAGKEMDVKVTLAELPEDPAQIMGLRPQRTLELLEGVQVADLNPENREEHSVSEDVKGVLVTNVDPESVAADSGLRDGQVIVEINENAVTSVEEAIRERLGFEGQVLLLRVSAASAESVVAVRVKDNE